jgi:uncharacterized integral membrane protein
MKAFIASVIVFMGLTLFITSNSVSVPLHFLSWTRNVPLAYVLIFPIGITLILAAFYNMLLHRKSNIVIRDLEDNLQSEQEKTIAAVKRAHELEIENQKLKIRHGETDVDEDSL